MKYYRKISIDLMTLQLCHAKRGFTLSCVKDWIFSLAMIIYHILGTYAILYQP